MKHSAPTVDKNILDHMFRAWDAMRARNGYGPCKRTKAAETVLKKLAVGFFITQIASPEYIARFYEMHKIFGHAKAGLSPVGAGTKLFAAELMEEHINGLECEPEFVTMAGAPPDHGYTAYNIALMYDMIKRVKSCVLRNGNIDYVVLDPASTSNPSWLRLCAARFLAELGTVTLSDAEKAAELYGAEAWDYYVRDPSIRKIFDNWILTPQQCFGEFVEKPIPTITKYDDEEYAEKLGLKRVDTTPESANLVNCLTTSNLPPLPPVNRKHA